MDQDLLKVVETIMKWFVLLRMKELCQQKSERWIVKPVYNEYIEEGGTSCSGTLLSYVLVGFQIGSGAKSQLDVDTALKQNVGYGY